MATRERLEQALMNAHAAGDTDAAKAFANAIRSGQFDDAESQEEDGSIIASANEAIMGSSIGRTASEFAAGVNRGAAGLVDMAASLPNAVLELAGSDARIPSAVEGLSAATSGNFMEDGLGKDIVRQGGELIPAALATGQLLRQGAAALPSMGRASESVAAGTLRQMGSSTAGQDAGYAALSGAGSAIGQDVGGDAGGMIGGMLAPALPALLRSSGEGLLRGIFGPSDRSLSAKIIDDFASFGEVPTVGMASGRGGVQGAENVSSSALGGSPLTRKSESISANIQKRLIDISDDISTTKGAESAGLEIQKGITGKGGFLDRFRSRSSVLWNKFDDLVDPSQSVSPDNTKNKINELVRGGAVGDILDNPKLIQIKSVLDDVDTLTYRDLKDLRSSIGAKIGNNELVSDIPRAELKQLYGALSDDIRSVASATSPEALNSFKRANTYSRAGHDRIDDYLERVVNKVDPDKVYAAVTKGGEGTGTINAFKRSLKPEEWEVVVSNVVRRLGRASSGNQNAVGDDAVGDAFSVAKFVSDWDKLGPARKALFSGSNKIESYGDDLAKIARAASVVKESAKRSANASGTAQAASRIAAGTGLATGVVTSNPTLLAATASSIAMNNAGARLMTNPRFVKWLSQSAKIPTSRSAAAIAQLVNVADQSSAEDAAIIQQLTEELEEQQ